MSGINNGAGGPIPFPPGAMGGDGDADEVDSSAEADVAAAHGERVDDAEATERVDDSYQADIDAADGDSDGDEGASGDIRL